MTITLEGNSNNNDSEHIEVDNFVHFISDGIGQFYELEDLTDEQQAACEKLRKDVEQAYKEFKETFKSSQA